MIKKTILSSLLSVCMVLTMLPISANAAAGEIWTSRVSPVISNLNGICYGNSTFVAVGANGTILSSGPDASMPTVTSISPASGSAGTTVTITGTGFTGASAVKFGTDSATSVTVDSDTQITATSPAGSGTVDVTVTTAGGTSATSSADQFTYNAAPTAKSTVPTQLIIGTGTARFTASDIAQDADNDTLSITAIAAAPDSAKATADLLIPIC
ncbi:IPT/TIG domain-containing protein [Caproiciproducens sp.]|uniref:IPT/TIG domain-containing protein n=1 Tax=Caproiciproducens sp. TaxID=1954376 RepID=UPI00289E311D|nr:IPT/TIG domain-containing protein [Caproiciproducens sp.]